MNLKVNQDKCIGCGQCVSICEDVFNFNDDGLAEVIETPVKEEHIEDIDEFVDSLSEEEGREIYEELIDYFVNQKKKTYIVK